MGGPSTNGDTPRVASTWRYGTEPPVGNRIGVAVSGGGIRSASFGLGALQYLEHVGLLRRVRYLSTVSGGSYIGAAVACAHTMSDPAALTDEEPAPWARGSREEEYLRNNLGFLAPGSGGRIWFAANVLYGVVLNLLPLLSASFLVGKALGALYRQLHPGIHQSELSKPVIIAAILAVLGLTALAMVVVAVRRLSESCLGRRGDVARPAAPATPPPGDQSARGHVDLSSRIITSLVVAAGVVALVLIVIPAAAAGLEWLFGATGLRDESVNGVDWLLQRVARGSVLVTIALALGGLAMLLLRLHRLPRTAYVIALLAGPLIICTPCLLAVESTSMRAWSRAHGLTLVMFCALIVLLFAFVVHNRRYSMHLFYRERLASAFFLARTRHKPDGDIRVDPVPYRTRIYLSTVDAAIAQRDLPLPELLVGAAVNTNDRRVPFRDMAAPFVFAGQRSGGDAVSWVDTEVLEQTRREGGADLTLQSMIAISGAALSPVMGRLTRPPFRFLMALLNIRLGVWIPNPFRHGGTDDSREPTTDEGEDAGLTAVPPQPAADAPLLGRVSHYLKAGWFEPGAWYVMKEALGVANTSGRYIYVTDGGHWENLGLYELVRRRCSHIVVLDASLNRATALADLSRASALCFTHLGATIEFDDWQAMVDGAAASAPPVMVGRVRYPDAEDGYIVYCRAALWSGVAFELQTFAQLDTQFPRHSTANQFLSADQFDAYRRLGWSVAAEAVRRMEVGLLPGVEFDERRDGVQEVHAASFVMVD